METERCGVAVENHSCLGRAVIHHNDGHYSEGKQRRSLLQTLGQAGRRRRRTETQPRGKLEANKL